MTGQRKIHRAVIAVFACVQFLFAASGRADSVATTQSSDGATAAQTTLDSSSKVKTPVHELTSLSLEQLMDVEVDTTNTLTRTDRSLVPAAVASIDRSEIDQANPRSLIDLLNIYVPNFESSPNQYEQTIIGERGINGDRDNKFLVLVDGREMNERSHGFLPELDQLLLGDLREVDTVEGPGSSTYGPGAVAGVIALQTYSGLTYQGTDVNVRGGALDEFYSAEFKHGEKLSPESGWFIYGGAAQLTGASQTYSPIIQGSTFDASYGHVTGGKPLPFGYVRDQAEFEGVPDVKAHAQFDSGGLTLWTRYTQGGQSNYAMADRGWYSPGPIGFNNQPFGYGGVGYSQLTGFAGYKARISPTLKFDGSTSLDFTNFQRIVFGYLNDNNQEIKLISKAMLNWDMTPSNQLAAGLEYREYWMGEQGWLGRPQNLLPGSDTSNGLDSGLAESHSFESNMLSFLAEDQWHMDRQWTLLLSGRLDKDRYTGVLFSPRAALSWQPNSRDTLKFLANRSLRTNDEEDMRAQWENARAYSHPEIVSNLEFRYERQQADNLFMALSTYYNKLDAIDWTGTAESSLGSYQTAGIQAEMTYRTPDDAITFSHGFTKLIGQNLTSKEYTNVTAALYGYGYDLSNWSNNITKLTAHHRIDRHFSVDGNVQVEWDFAGNRDVRRYENATSANGVPFGTLNSSAFDSNIFLNAGLQYKVDDHSTFRLDAYNIMGWFNQSFDKQEGVNGSYRVAAPAFGLSYNYTF